MIRYVLLDLDDTLLLATATPCADAVAVLAACQQRGIRVAIVSHCSDARTVCERQGWADWVDAYFAWGAYDKKQHLVAALAHYRALPSECLFFDDMVANLADAAALHIRAVHVSWKTGITLSLLLDSLALGPSLPQG
jgi:FMN phosphatase YigB (HAD superfamily)